MAKEKSIDFLLLGPAHPYRGGIADTQMQLAKALMDLNYTVELWSFTHLYPSVLFPGKTQYSQEENKFELPIQEKVHAYNPLQWKALADEINHRSPQAVVFRYWTPFLAPAWVRIAQKINNSIRKVALVDNWTAHEPKPWDRWLTHHFEQQMDIFTTLSIAIRDQIKNESTKPTWGSLHPVAIDLPSQIPQQKAREKLNLRPEKKYLLFFGLIRPYKGLELLLNALQDHPNLHLMIVGECYENEYKYRSIIKQLKLEQRVVFENRFVNDRETAHYFSAADALILPYTSASQSGVLALAYHFETPVLVTDHKGLADPILADQTGLVCGVDTKQIAQGITEVMDANKNQFFRKNLRENKTNYRWSTYAQAWANFILNDKKKD